MALEKSYSKDFESDELFDYEIIKPKKTLKIQYTYAKRYHKEVEKFAKNLTQLTQEEFMRLREPQKTSGHQKHRQHDTLAFKKGDGLYR